MIKIKKQVFIKFIFLFINIILVMGIAWFIFITTNKIYIEDNAREFIEQLNAIPKYPKKICVRLFFLIVVLTCNIIVREKTVDKIIILLSLFVDFVCSLFIIFILDFNYNGVLLLVFSNVITYVKEKKIRFILISFAMITYLFADYNLMSISYKLFSIHDYIRYYEFDFQKIILSFYNILVSMNILTFILYCINIINEQDNTIQKVNEFSKELQNSNDRLKKYNIMAEKMIETRERNRIAREIHDTLGHVLTGISAGVDACLALIETDREQTRKRLEIISKTVRKGIKDVRRSVSELRPDALEHFNLDDAVKDMIKEINLLSGIQVILKSDFEKLKFSEDEENIIYRIIQEGITNSIKHGKATKVKIFIEEGDGFLNLQIKDNGCGCKFINKGFGTTHMEKRVEMLGGNIDFFGEEGFTINAKIPIRWRG